MDELQQLVAPVALYPDALLAQVLAASTYPDDVVAAARWEDAGNNPQAADSQPWDTSVKGVARYPDVLHYMASNGDWMNDLGDAFLNQQGDVMSAVQTMRGQALAAGTLASTPEQTVINQDGYIQIIPTDPQYLYAPIYDPQVVYSPPEYAAGQPYPVYIHYGPRVEVGDWLDYDLDWHDRAIYFGSWGRDRPWWNDRDAHGGYHYLTDRPGVYRPGAFRDQGGRPIQVQASHWERDNRRPAPRRAPGPAARPSNERPDRGYPQRQPAANNNRPPETPHGSDVARQSERGRTSREQAAQPRPEPRQTPQQTPRSNQPAPRAAEPTPRAQPTPRAPEATPRAPEQTPRQAEPAPRSAQPAPRAAEPAPRAPQPTPRAPEPAPRAPTPAPRAPEPSRAAPRQSTPAPEARPSAPTRGGAMGGYQNGASAAQSAQRGAASRGKH
ncbi:MAG TPA: DUF3300 domain-containing protein [Tepidisphaeraceae bacterium]|jgi:hypothetical protein|nr:DUF3300 domain-containing protein [Tepidisphaeraceae bacterium]